MGPKNRLDQVKKKLLSIKNIYLSTQNYLDYLELPVVRLQLSLMFGTEI